MYNVFCTHEIVAISYDMIDDTIQDIQGTFLSFLKTNLPKCILLI